mmetsp:Transcript_19420/g.29838  ORF Transcript_19420/g.29838 Transcript_19420/m.29838 type:complete len:271 (+) Transcript_19420:785-1597(+)
MKKFMEPLRCSKCLAYINLHSRFTDGGTKVACNLCGNVSLVPPELQGPINIDNGSRQDTDLNPQYSSGTFEFKLWDSTCFPEEYKSSVSQPHFVFCIDIGPQAIMNGFFYTTITTIKSCLDYFPYPASTNLTLMTYDSALQFYVMPQDETKEPSIFIVTDVEDPFVPYPLEKLMLNVELDRERISALLDKLIEMYYTESRKIMQIQTCQGAAIHAATQMLQETGGRVVSFMTTPCSAGAGLLKQRDDGKGYNTDAEKALYKHTPEHSFYA